MSKSKKTEAEAAKPAAAKDRPGYWHGYKIEEVRVADLKPYGNNPRFNEAAVPSLMACIKAVGFINPIVVNADNVIINGHTRRLAAMELGMDVVPCIRPTDLTPKQIRLLRLADNKISEQSSWDFGKLDKEIAEIAKMDGDAFDMADFGFPSSSGDDLEDLFSGATQRKPTASEEKPAIIHVKCPHCGEEFDYDPDSDAE